MVETWIKIEDEPKLKGYEWTDDGDGRYRIRAEGKTYDLKVAGMGTVSCTCKGNTYNGKCKHADYMRIHVKMDRVPREWAAQYLDIVVKCLQPLFNSSQWLSVAGSFLRGKQTVKDLDLVLLIPYETSLIEIASRIQSALPSAYEPSIEPKSGRIVRGKLDGFGIDLYLCRANEFGAMMMFLTGPKEWNIYTRRLAQAKGLRLSQYGLFVGETQELACDCSSEALIFAKLGIPFATPAERESFTL